MNPTTLQHPPLFYSAVIKSHPVSSIYQQPAPIPVLRTPILQHITGHEPVHIAPMNNMRSPPAHQLRAPGPGQPGSATSPSAPLRAMGWFPDVYTTPFVSEHQRAINTMPAAVVKALPPPCIDFQKFIESFIGKGFLGTLPEAPPPLPQQNEVPVRNAVERSTLTPVNYGEHFAELLGLELSALNLAIQGYNLYNVQITPQDPTNPSQYLFRLSIPGIREDTPLVQLGDLVKLRQIRPAQAMYPAAFTGYEYETFIYGMDKALGYVVLRADGLWVESGGRFNVMFNAQHYRWDGARRAIADIGKSLYEAGSGPSDTESQGNPFAGAEESSSQKPLPSCFLRKILFPDQEDGVMQHSLAPGDFERQWIDKDLNYEQQKAVDSILRQNYGNIPFLISGPPGTGKTKTIVEAVLQLIYAPRTPRHHILLCAPSQEAADTLSIRLSKHLTPSVLFRLQASGRTFPEVPTKLMLYSYIENDMFSIPDWKTLMRFRVIVCSCRDAEILMTARCTNRDLGRWEKGIVDSLRGISEGSAEFVERGEAVRLHWSALLVDEAAQGLESDMAIPLAVVAPPEDASDDKPIVVMAGDQKQLGPITATKRGLQISTFERLFERPIYSEHPLRRELYTEYGMKTTRNPKRLDDDGKAKLLPYLYPPFANLVRNYRNHPAILALPSAVFYNDSLIPEARETERLQDWKGWKGSRGIPVKFILNSGHDESHEEMVSFYNNREIELAVKCVQNLLSPDSWPFPGKKSNVPIAANEIAVMTPFREQVKRLRLALRSVGLRSVNVGPVEAYQGSEYRFVIICTTRARERFLKNDKEKGVGVILEPRRINVAMTRAKEGLAVIGNPWMLEKDPTWREWMNFAWRHHAVEPDPEDQSAVQSQRDQKQENKGAKEAAAFSAFPAPKTYSSAALIGRTKPVNEWKPRGDDIEIAGCISRLESALVFKSKARDGAVFRMNAGWDEDDPLFLSGIVEGDAEVGEEQNGGEHGLGLGL